MLRSMMQDVRYALRQWRRAPGFALTTLIVLALGLGANIAVFTILNGLLLRPLPFAHADRIVSVEPSGQNPGSALNYANMLRLRDAVGPRLQIGAALCCNQLSSVVGPGGRVQVEKEEVTTDLPRTLGMPLRLGRYFRDDESEPGRNRVVLIGEDVWRTLYHSDAHVIGETLTIKSQPFMIIGVMPSGLAIPYDAPMQVWSPAPLTPANRSSMGKGSVWGSMYARLPEGMTTAQLADQLNRTQAIVAKEVVDSELPTQVKVTAYQQALTQQARKPLWLLYCVVLGVWALACLNVTSLMLARAVSRGREQSVRVALGASRGRLIQQTVVETLMLSAMGALIGLLAGQTAIKLLWRQIHRMLPLTSAIHVDWRVVCCLAALTLVTAVVVGIIPALRAVDRSVANGLKGTTTTASTAQSLTRETLVVGQLALTLVFLVSAGLFLRTINALRQVPLGFTQQNVLTGGVILNGASTSIDDDTKAATSIVITSYQPLLDRMRAIPGVQVAALSSVLPLRSEMMVTISAAVDHGKERMADGRIASPGLVDALGIPVVRGRFFTEDDVPISPPVVVINQAFADKYLPGQDPIGHTVSMGKGRFSAIRIVGVVADIKQSTVVDPTRPEIYFPLAQTEPDSALYGIVTAFMQVAIRAAVPADTLRAQFDKALHEVAPDAATTDVKTVHQAVEDSFGSQALIARLLATFAGLALMIATVGLFGLLSFAVAQRTREIGIRMALGAPQTNILGLVLRRALLLVAVGITIGAVLAWFATRFAGTYIYGVRTHDAVTFAAVTMLLAASSFLAAWLPARRAAAVDPILALRSE